MRVQNGGETNLKANNHDSDKTKIHTHPRTHNFVLKYYYPI